MGRKCIIHIGQKFGRWLVLEKLPIKYKPPKWLCECECGVIKPVFGRLLRTGRSKSCGCFKAEVMGIQSKLHGLWDTPEYTSYSAMVTRCTNKNHTSYDFYGNKGIKICKRWLEKEGAGFTNFLSDMGRRPQGTSLDRINPEQGYEKENCRWATNSIQGYNRILKHKIYRGVSARSESASWTARIMCKGKTYYLGKFDNPEHAAIAYNNKALELFGKDAKLNKI